MLDQYGRDIDYLRISVTDKCNFKCVYCMPCEGVPAMCHEEILRLYEIEKICRCAVKLGIHKIKITGGEPFVRKGVIDLIERIHEIDGIEKITITTNGYFLQENLSRLKEAGVTGINVSLDTVHSESFRQITGCDAFEKVMKALKEAEASGFSTIKVNCVLMEKSREGLMDVAKLAKDFPIHVRYIEMMPIGMGGFYQGLSQEAVLKEIRETYGNVMPCLEHLGNGPAKYYQLDGFQGKIGFISAMSHEFCEACNRVRLTADGFLKLCLNYDSKVNLRDYIRQGHSDAELEQYMYQAIYGKPARHGFSDMSQIQRETRQMVGIGG